MSEPILMAITATNLLAAALVPIVVILAALKSDGKPTPQAQEAEEAPPYAEAA